MNVFNLANIRIATSVLIVIILLFFAIHSLAQDIDTDVLAARRAAISAYTNGIVTDRQPINSKPDEVALNTNWLKEARVVLAAENCAVSSLNDLDYQELKARYVPRLAHSLGDLHTALADVYDTNAPIAWRCMVIETLPALLADPDVSVSGLVGRLEPLIRSDPSLAVRSAAIAASEAVILQNQTGAYLSITADAVVSSIVRSSSEIMDKSDNAEPLTAEQSAALSGSFQALLRLVRHTSIDKEKYRERIVAWGMGYRRFGYGLCLDYMRLLKSGYGVDPSANLYDHAKNIAQSKSESTRVDFIHNIPVVGQ